MHTADTQCMVWREGAKGLKNLKFNFSCLAIKYKFYFTETKGIT